MASHTWNSKPTLLKAALLMRGYRYALACLPKSYILSRKDLATSFAGYYVERKRQAGGISLKNLAGSLSNHSLDSPNSFSRNSNYTVTWTKHEEANLLPIGANERWLSSTVLDLIQSPEVHMGPLGDALLDAGCDSDVIIAACMAKLPEEIPYPDDIKYRSNRVRQGPGHNEYAHVDHAAFRASPEYKLYRANAMKRGTITDNYQNVITILGGDTDEHG